ncbi:hypothetical protein M422DRAFT_26212 [Sphaerobolus stellatus SS14]|nr:hypothetical protein M422DRAFT_26212 [Sphaerobolus stellatus SS14]
MSCTIYPRIRSLFLLSQRICDRHSKPNMKCIASTSKRNDGLSNVEWKFYQPLTIASLSNNDLTKLVDEYKPAKSWRSMTEKALPFWKNSPVT